MFKLVLLAFTIAMVASCTKKQPVLQDFKVGECIHHKTGVYKVTVVGQMSYGLLQEGHTTEGKYISKFYTIPKVDLSVRDTILTDCMIDMEKKNNEYIESNK